MIYGMLIILGIIVLIGVGVLIGLMWSKNKEVFEQFKYPKDEEEIDLELRDPITDEQFKEMKKGKDEV